MTRALLACLVVLGGAPGVAQEIGGEGLLGMCLSVAGADGAQVAHCRDLVAGACRSGRADGETTLGIVACAEEEFRAWEVAVAAEAEALSAEVDAARVTAAQEAWTAARQADCALRVTRWEGGTLAQVGAAECMVERTMERLVDLRAFRASLGQP